MSVRVSWAVGPSGTTEYVINSGTSSTGPFYEMAIVQNDYSWGSYDTESGLYYYDDLVGSIGTFYIVSASNGVSILETSYEVSPSVSGTFVTTIPTPPSVDGGGGSFDAPPPAPIGYATDVGPLPPVGSATPI